jgi:uncharacterized protein
MNRVESVRQVVDGILRQQPDVEERRCGFVHLYGVAQACALLALKRGLDPELSTVAGMLHDIWTYKTGEPRDHAAPGSAEAQKIMSDLDASPNKRSRLLARRSCITATKAMCTAILTSC